MTLITAFMGRDQRKMSSLYILSDSRFTWSPDAKKNLCFKKNLPSKFDFGKKVFCFKNSPDIIGYCGDVLFPTIVLNQLVELCDNDLLFNEPSNNEEKFKSIFNYLKTSLAKYPQELATSMDIIYGTRSNKIDFSLYLISWRNNEWYSEKKQLLNSSGTLIIKGSGKKDFIEKYNLYQETSIKDTSRVVFQSFCHALSETNNLYCGGAPQLVGLYNKGNGMNIGIISNNKRYFCGLEINEVKIGDNIKLNKIKWHNENFEVCNGYTMEKEIGSQKQPNPVKNISK